MPPAPPSPTIKSPADASFSIPFKPIAGKQRIESLDVLRGLALLGILVVNSLIFSLPMTEGMAPPFEHFSGRGGSTADWISWWIVSVFFHFKFISIFSLLFGIGAAIQFDRARATGQSFGWFFIRRLVILLGFGVVHALVFWYGDILTLYSLIGVWLLVLCRLSTKVLVVVSVLLLAFTALLMFGLTALGSLDPPNPALGEVPTEVPATAFAAMQEAMFDPNTPTWQMAEERAYAEGPYADLFVFRLVSWIFAVIFAGLSYGWHILAMFALGVALVRSGFFGGGGGMLRCYAVAIALPIGLVLEALCVFATMRWSTDHLWAVGIASAVREFSVTLVAIGYMGLVTWLVRSGVLGMLAYVTACVGRMALTNYLLETVVMTSIFYYYGLGLFAGVDRIWLLAMSICLWIVLAIFSTLWLSVFARGPLEWLWRLLSYMRLPGRG